MNQADDATSKVDWEEGGGSRPQNVTIAGFSSVKLEDNPEQSSWFITPRVGSTSLPTTLTSCLHPVAMSQNGKMYQNYVEENEVETEYEVITELGGRRRSEVWKDFTVEKKPDGTLWARCKHCKKLLTAKTNSGTGHLQRHVKNHCGKKAQKDKQMFISYAPKEPTGDTNDFTFNQDVSRKDLAKLIICAELPFNIVENPVFINFVKNLQPLFQFVDQATLRNDCVALYDEEKKKVYDMLANVKARVSLTFDLWTSSEKLGYIALTAHFVNEDFILMKKMLNFRRIVSPQASHVINNEIAKCIVEWGLNEKLFTLTLRNCTTNDILVTRFRENWGEKLMGSGNYFHIRCCSHILNSMVQDGMEVIRFAIEHIRNIIIYVTISPSRTHVFNEIAEQCGLDTGKGLTLDVSKRWNDTYDMLQSALLYKEAFIRYAKVHYHITDAPTPTDDDWEQVEVMMKILKAFCDTNSLLSGARHPSANLYFKEVWGIRQLLSKEVTNSDEVIREIILEMQKKFKKYWNECNMILAIASVLDPRFKCLFIQYCYEKAFSEEEAKQRVDEIQDCLCNLYNDYEKALKVETESKISSELRASSSILEYTGKRKLEMEFEAYLSQKNQKKPKKSELDTYLNDDLFPVIGDEDFSVLSWWKNNASVYPVLSRMAQDVLAIPVSTIAFESAFSYCDRLIDQCGRSLDSSLVEALICTQDWFCDDNFGSGDAGTDLSLHVADEDLYESCLAE